VVVGVFQLSLGECSAARGRPVDGLASAVDVTALDHLGKYLVQELIFRV